MTDSALALRVHVVRVFTGPEGGFGNPLGVVFDAAGYDSELGIRLTSTLGFSETVFIDDFDEARLRIFTPAAELPLAGHPLVGTAWLLGEISGRPPEALRPRLTEPVTTWSEGVTSWIRGRLADAPPWQFVRVDSVDEVEALSAPPAPEYDHHLFWSWLNEPQGEVRARAFAPRVGVPEDEATGSAAMLLAATLDRPLTIHQGRGSLVRARPAETSGLGEVGGAVTSDDVRIMTL